MLQRHNNVLQSFSKIVLRKSMKYVFEAFLIIVFFFTDNWI